MKATTATQRNTRQRQAIYKAIQGAGRPLTPQEILDGAQQQVPALGIATVYRNLKLLMKEGGIRAVELPAEVTRYEVVQQTCEHHHHHHFLCTQCKRAFEVHGCAHDFSSMVPAGFKMQAHEITLYGLCAGCV